MARSIQGPEYTNYTRLVHKLAWQYAKALAKSISIDLIDYQKELVSVGNLAFCKAFVEWNPERSKLITFAWAYIEVALFNHNKITLRMARRDSGFDTTTAHNMFDFDSADTPPEELLQALSIPAMQERRASFWSTIRSLSSEAQEVVSIVLSSPKEVLGVTGTEPPKAVRGILFRHLRSKGWKWPTIWRTFREVKEVCI